MGITKLLDIIIGILIVVIASIAIWQADVHFFNVSSSQSLAQKTAYYWNTYAGALNSYVEAEQNNAIPENVTCSDLQTAGFLSTSYSCTDPLGETLTGYVSSPWGFPLTWLVVASSAPDAGILSKYGLNNPLKWKAFTFAVAQDSMNYGKTYTAFSINSGEFSLPGSDVESQLINYFPESDVPVTQSLPDIVYYDNFSIVVSPNIQKNPVYWLFLVSTYSTGNTGDINYQNLGESTVCPEGGIKPVTSSSTIDIKALDSPNIGNPSGNIDGVMDPSFSYYSNMFYLCLPTSKSLINSNSTVFPNDDVSSTGGYASDMMVQKGIYYNGSSDSLDDNTANQPIPFAGQAFNISDRGINYTYIVSIGFAVYPSVWWSYFFNASLTIGTETKTCVETALYNDIYVADALPCWSINDMGGYQNINL